MIAGTIPVTIDDAWLWGLLVLFVVLFLTSGGRFPWLTSNERSPS